MEFSWSYGETEKIIRMIKRVDEREQLRRIAKVTAKQLQTVGVQVKFRSAGEEMDMSGMSDGALLALIENAAAELRRRGDG